MRYILEGEWSGYTASQRRVVHREVVKSKARIDRLRTLHGIRYTDGTTLILSLRETKPREHVHEIPGYTSLIREAEKSSFTFFVVS